MRGDLELTPSALNEAKTHLKEAPLMEQKAFAIRQLNSRKRLTQLLQFYGSHPCRMARLHLLAACAVVLGRFAGYSQNFDVIGQAMMPVDSWGHPQTQAWELYQESCEKGHPWEVRDELWLKAHMQDLRAIHEARLDQSFYQEHNPHVEETIWQLLKQHMEVTLGTRLMDRSALSGAVAYETAMAHSLGLTVERIFSKGIRLIGFYASKTLKALFSIRREPSHSLVSYRRTAAKLMRYFVTAWSAARVFRQGMRNRDRGAEAHEEGWSLLEEVLAEKVDEVHPQIIQFYRNPSAYQVQAEMQFKTSMARFWSWWVTLLLGQGLYEAQGEPIETRFRVFKRQDGSMHFIRELYCGGTRRIFDSDFVVRKVQGQLRLYEVFVDLKIEVEMEVTPLARGGLSICGKRIYWHKLRLPSFGFQVEFVSRVITSETGHAQLRIDGSLLLKPRTKFGRFLVSKILRRPEQLAAIHYSVHSPASMVS